MWVGGGIKVTATSPPRKKCHIPGRGRTAGSSVCAHVCAPIYKCAHLCACAVCRNTEALGGQSPVGRASNGVKVTGRGCGPSSLAIVQGCRVDHLPPQEPHFLGEGVWASPPMGDTGVNPSIQPQPSTLQAALGQGAAHLPQCPLACACWRLPLGLSQVPAGSRAWCSSSPNPAIVTPWFRHRPQQPCGHVCISADPHGCAGLVTASCPPRAA